MQQWFKKKNVAQEKDSQIACLSLNRSLAHSASLWKCTPKAAALLHGGSMLVSLHFSN